jgi:hypothetical protein
MSLITLSICFSDGLKAWVMWVPVHIAAIIAFSVVRALL